jgi:heme/copper-type cytochrome/quinol oxidase subunit 2
MRASHRHDREPRVAAAKKQLLIGLAARWLAASSRAARVLDPQGPVGSAERLILLNATGIMLVVVVPVIVLTLGFAWWVPNLERRFHGREQS